MLEGSLVMGQEAAIVLAALVGVIGTLLGVIVSGLLQLLAEHLRHKRLRTERVQEALLTERLNLYRRLAIELNGLSERLPVLALGLEILRWPKDRRISPKFFGPTQDESVANQRRMAQQADHALRSLDGIVRTNRLFIGKKVHQCFLKQYHEVQAWRILLETRKDFELMQKVDSLHVRIMDAIRSLQDKTQEAIIADLGPKQAKNISPDSGRFTHCATRILIERSYRIA